ncbi:MAG TPA: hypothetical protein VG519_02550 [Pseudochrobactrum sp.]|nr:hypothetical protein [Pseudochrobactrum sp.]
MCKFYSNDYLASQDMFADPAIDDADQYSTEDFCNPYAEASQARGASRTPEPIIVSVSDQGAEPQNITEFNQTGSAETLVNRHVPQKPKSEMKSDGDVIHHANTSGEAPRLMTVKEVAAYLAISISKVWRLEKRKVGFPKAIRICCSTRWDRYAIDRYLDSQQTPENSEY